MPRGRKRGRTSSRARAALSDTAPAKVNLTLRVLSRRDDGYHEIESLVVFANVADRLTLRAADKLSLDISGAFASGCGPKQDNLVLKATAALGMRVKNLKAGRFGLVKNIPAAAGLGGGSADAAAALRLLARLNRLKRDDPRLMAAARATGADVPVCLDPRPRVMRGVGEKLSTPVKLPKLFAVLARPAAEVRTKAVFEKLDASRRAARQPVLITIPPQRAKLLDWLAAHGNHLEDAAMKIEPAVGEVLAALRALPGCQLARMSGSGATCFALFATRAAAGKAARQLKRAHKGWWITPATFG